MGVDKNNDGVDPHPPPVLGGVDAASLDHLLSVSPVGDGVWEPWLVHGVVAQPGLHDTTHENGAIVVDAAVGDMAAAAEADDDEEDDDEEEDDDLHLDYLALANLRILFRQERDPDYGVTDYLGIRQQQTSTTIKNQQQQQQQQQAINKKRKRGEPLPRPPWKMDACNRWEIGEWCYGRTFCISLLLFSFVDQAAGPPCSGRMGLRQLTHHYCRLSLPLPTNKPQSLRSFIFLTSLPKSP
jgi:hypothetical protein